METMGRTEKEEGKGERLLGLTRGKGRWMKRRGSGREAGREKGEKERMERGDGRGRMRMRMQNGTASTEAR
jgi:hypothetical protein